MKREQQEEWGQQDEEGATGGIGDNRMKREQQEDWRTIG